MVAVTPRVLARSVYRMKMMRNEGAAFGYEIGVDENNEKLKKMVAGGLTNYGGTINLESLSPAEQNGMGLYAYGSGLMSYGSGAVPLGMGIFSALKGFAKKAFSGIRNVIPKNLKSMALDYGKKRAKEVLPQVIDKVKGEIRKTAPNAVLRFTAPLLAKLPPGMQGPASALLNQGANRGVDEISRGLAKLKQKVSGEGLFPYGMGIAGMNPNFRGPRTGEDVGGPSVVAPDVYSQAQLEYLARKAAQNDALRLNGDQQRRVMLDQSALKLRDIIAAEHGYNRAVGHPGPGAMVLYAPPKKRAPVKKAAGKAVKKPRAVGSGIVYK